MPVPVDISSVWTSQSKNDYDDDWNDSVMQQTWRSSLFGGTCRIVHYVKGPYIPSTEGLKVSDGSQNRSSLSVGCNLSAHRLFMSGRSQTSLQLCLQSDIPINKWPKLPHLLFPFAVLFNSDFLDRKLVNWKTYLEDCPSSTLDGRFYSDTLQQMSEKSREDFPTRD